MRRFLTLLLFCFSAQVLAQCKSIPAESFQDFITKFSESKSFAISRTNYPTYNLRHEAGVENGKELISVKKTTVSITQDKTTPTIKQILNKNQMVMKTKAVKKTEATVDIFKPDTDWLLTYHFVEHQGCWFLQHIEDHSL